jgi:hypothetical protein
LGPLQGVDGGVQLQTDTARPNQPHHRGLTNVDVPPVHRDASKGRHHLAAIRNERLLRSTAASGGQAEDEVEKRDEQPFELQGFDRRGSQRL